MIYSIVNIDLAHKKIYTKKCICERQNIYV